MLQEHRERRDPGRLGHWGKSHSRGHEMWPDHEELDLFREKSDAAPEHSLTQSP